MLQVAWVTKSGKSDLPRPIAIRPTSETVMYPYYAQVSPLHLHTPLSLDRPNNLSMPEVACLLLLTIRHPTDGLYHAILGGGKEWFQYHAPRIAL